MTRREAERLAHQESTLVRLGFTHEEAAQLRRISMTLRRWHELECGDGHGVLERDEKTNRPYWRASDADDARRIPVADRETGARRRLAAILNARNNRSGENPPEDWEDCEQCGSCHPAGYTGDCRDDSQRWPGDSCKPLAAFIQTDPRGAALYILRPGDVPEGEDASAYYSRGICVY